MGLSHPPNACSTILWDGQKLHTNRIVRVHINVWRLRTVSSPVQKEYLKKIPSHLLFRPNPATNKVNVFFNCRLDYWSGHGRTNRTVCYGPATHPNVNWTRIFKRRLICASMKLNAKFKSYASFHVPLARGSWDYLLDAAVWPQGVLIKEFNAKL